LVFDVSKAREDSRVPDLAAASTDRRLADATAGVVDANAARANLTSLSGVQEGRGIADMLAPTRPPRLDSPFLRAFAGNPASGALPGAVRPDNAYARRISTFADSSLFKTVTGLGSLAGVESQASTALNAYTATSIAGGFRNLGPLEESMRRWRSIYDNAFENTASKQLAAMQRSLAGQYADSFIQIKKSLDVQSTNIGTQVIEGFLRAHEPQLRSALDAVVPPLSADIGRFATVYSGLAQWFGERLEAFRPKLDGVFEWLRREAGRWPRDPYGEPVPFWNVRLYRLARAAYQGDYVARARFLDEIEADGSPDNVLMIEELLKATFDPQRLDRRVDWEQMDPVGARRWLRSRLDGLKLSARREEQERKNAEQPYEEESSVVEAITSDVPELEFMEFELREDERALYEQLRGVLPEQQYWFCWHRAQGLTYEEIAARMGVASGTIKGHAYYLRRNPRFLEVLGR